MSVETKLQIRSLARDPSGQLATQVDALRRAENVVLRAPGVAESRPNFDLLYEPANTTYRVRALREFMGEVVAVDEDIASPFNWRLRRLASGTQFTNPGLFNATKPPSYNDAETKFAEARESLYFTAEHGMLKLDVVTNVTDGLDWAGVDMITLTDLATTNGYGGYSVAPGTAGTTTGVSSWAYQFVFVRKDANGYTRRSAPSERYIVTSPSASLKRAAARIYFDRFLRAGDQVEIYRTRRADGNTPSTELFLATVHTITTAELANHYFAMVYDSVLDDQLGATLYTSPSQGGALAAKFPPPVAQAVAWWQSVMWYGRTKSKQRTKPITIRSVGEGGVFQTGYYGRNFGVFVVGSAVVTGCVDTSGMKAGDYVSDNLRNGTALAGTYIAALTTIVSVDSPTQITMSAVAIADSAGVSKRFGVMLRYAPSGIQSHNPGGPAGTGGDHTLGSLVVTGIASTAEFRVGMGWSDNATTPALAGTITQADTLITEITSSTAIKISLPALATSKGGMAFDCVQVGGVPFYAWGDDSYFAVPEPPWVFGPRRLIPFWCFSTPGFGSAIYCQAALASFMSSLVMTVNYYATQNPTFLIRASLFGGMNWDFIAPGGWGGSIVFEEIGLGRDPFDVIVSRPSAFDVTSATLTSDPDETANRLYWSALDEPEAVPLLNFVDIGTQAAPILALAPLTDALLVFKQDGVFRVTGSGPSSWSVECLDQELRILRPECVAVTGDKAYVWATQGFFSVTAQGATSLSATALDVELRSASQYPLASTQCHGAWVAAWRARQMVLFGVPLAQAATNTGRIYCYSLVTGFFSEWPLEWGPVAESKEDGLYYSRPPVASVIYYEVRQAEQNVRGYDRDYALSAVTDTGTTTITVSLAVAGRWIPEIGDMVSVAVGGFTYFRRITLAVYDGGTTLWTLTLEAAMPAGSKSGWTAYEVANTIIILEWHPASPAGIPVGSLCREIQVQMDLRDAPTEGSKLVSIPEYIVGGTPEYSTTVSTITSNRTRLAQIQPIRVGCSRQIMRSAMVAPYLKTSDIYVMRVNGISLVWEGASERTRR